MYFFRITADQWFPTTGHGVITSTLEPGVADIIGHGFIIFNFTYISILTKDVNRIEFGELLAKASEL